MHLAKPPAVERQANGRFASREAAREVGRLGGKAKANTTRLGHMLSINPGTRELRPYRRVAAAFARRHVATLARTVGGGQCAEGPASIVMSAALQLAASRWAFDHGKIELGSRLANDSRQNLLAAHELCAREAQARPRVPLSRRFGGSPETSEETSPSELCRRPASTKPPRKEGVRS